MNTQEEITNKLCKRLIESLENLLIEGLKRKGFEFNNNDELSEFVNRNCKCTDNIYFKERVYYVNDIPFFLHKYEIESNLNYNTDDFSIKMSANYGSYSFL